MKLMKLSNSSVCLPVTKWQWVGTLAYPSVTMANPKAIRRFLAEWFEHFRRFGVRLGFLNHFETTRSVVSTDRVVAPEKRKL